MKIKIVAAPCILVFLLSCNKVLSAQELIKSNEHDSLSRSIINSDINNTIKFNTCFIFRGILALSYERRLGSYISGEVGLGVTVSPDELITSNFEAAQVVTPALIKSSLSFPQLMSICKYSGMGPFASAAIRFHSYRYNVDIFSWFFEVNSRYYISKVKVQDNFEDNKLHVAPSEVTFKHTGLNLLVGAHLNTTGKIKTTHELYFGAGLIRSNYDVFNLTHPKPYEDYHVKSGERETVLSTLLLFGYVFGIGY